MTRPSEPILQALETEKDAEIDRMYLGHHAARLPSGPDPPGTRTVTWLPLRRISLPRTFLSPSGVYSTASSRTRFTKSSKPRSVPTSSVSPRMRIQICDPMALSISSRGRMRFDIAVLYCSFGVVWSLLLNFFVNFCTRFIYTSFYAYARTVKFTFYLLASTTSSMRTGVCIPYSSGAFGISGTYCTYYAYY